MRKATPRAMPSKRSPRAQSIDDYLAAVPKDARAALEKLRKTIQTAAPEATETISYQVPTFKHHGGLVAFAAFPDHCSFFVMSPKVMQTHAADLRGYKLGKATISFPADQPLPSALVTRLVKARIAENEAVRKA